MLGSCIVSSVFQYTLALDCTCRILRYIYMYSNTQRSIDLVRRSRRAVAVGGRVSWHMETAGEVRRSASGRATALNGCVAARLAAHDGSLSGGDSAVAENPQQKELGGDVML